MNLLPVVTRLRSLARKTGLLRFASRLSAARRSTYEERFSRALVEAVKPGDCVWDIGANLGYYTERFADRAGPFGLVVGFEPVPSCFAELSRKLGSRPGVQLRQEAVGSAEGSVPMALAADPLGATHTLVGASPRATEAHSAAGEAVEMVAVPVRRGDAVMLVDKVKPPTVVKIDVEGFEEEVVNGMAEVLARPACRAVFIEVHFALLEQKGTPQAPQAIVKQLRGLGFRTRWIDPSHLVAER